MIGKPKKNRPTARGSAARRASANGAPAAAPTKHTPICGDGKPPRRPAATRHKGRWCGWELTQLEALFGTRDDGSVARMLDRPIRSVRAQARTVFGAKPSRAGKPWVCDEDQRLRSCLGVSSLAVISLGIAPARARDRGACRGALHQSAFGDWCSEEVKSLKCLYGSRDDAVLSVILSRPVEEIQEKASEHRLAKSNALLRRLADESHRFSRRRSSRAASPAPRSTAPTARGAALRAVPLRAVPLRRWHCERCHCGRSHCERCYCAGAPPALDRRRGRGAQDHLSAQVQRRDCQDSAEVGEEHHEQGPRPGAAQERGAPRIDGKDERRGALRAPPGAQRAGSVNGTRPKNGTHPKNGRTASRPRRVTTPR